MRKFNSMMLTAAAVAMLGSAAYAAPAPFSYEYDGNALPPASTPAWAEVNTTAGASASVSGGILTTATTDLADNIEYYQSGPGAWNPTGAGTTVEARFKTNHGSNGYAGTLEIITPGSGGVDGRWFFLLLGNRWFTELRGGGELDLNSVGVHAEDDFHTYRFTLADENVGPLQLYVDDGTTPAYSWNGSSSGGRNRLAFGDGHSAANGDIQWDYIQWTNEGAFAPVVPEPTMISLAGLSAVAMLRRFRR